MCSASLRPAPSRSRSPSRWRAPESSPAARPATDLRRALWRASASPRCGGAGLPAPLPECRTGTDGSRVQSRRLPCPPLGRRVDPLIVEAVALRRRGELRRGRRTTATRRTIKDDTLRVPAASQCCSPHPDNPANSGGTSLARRRLSASVPAPGLASGRTFSPEPLVKEVDSGRLVEPVALNAERGEAEAACRQA